MRSIFLFLVFFGEANRLLIDAFSFSSITDDSTTTTAVLSTLLAKCSIPLSDVTAVQPVTTAKAAFCNTLYRVSTKNNLGMKKTYMLKIFSDLATSRIKAAMDLTVPHDHDSTQEQDNDSSLFYVDRLAAKHHLGPVIHASLDCDTGFATPALLMEYCAGRPLTTEDLYDEDGAIVHLAATALAKLHALELNHHPWYPNDQTNSNRLWQSCHVLMQQYVDPNWVASDGKQKRWTYSRLYDCIMYHESQTRKHRYTLLTTNTGHGDCKPSNLILHCPKSKQHCQLRFLDFELAGRNYVAFDIAKLWRSSSPMTLQSRHQTIERFLETYVAESGRNNLTTFDLQKQFDLLLPLTWLEAAVFFVAMSSQSKNQAERMQFDKLAIDRLQSYDECQSLFSQV
jgi:thiamine kinase-like enzyme